MNYMNPQDTMAKIILILPVLLCLITVFGIKKTDGRIIAGFNALSEAKKKELKDKGYIDKTVKMTIFMTVPLFVAFISSFIVTDIKLFNTIITISWGIFIVILIAGIIMINLSMKK